MALGIQREAKVVRAGQQLAGDVVLQQVGVRAPQRTEHPRLDHGIVFDRLRLPGASGEDLLGRLHVLLDVGRLE